MSATAMDMGVRAALGALPIDAVVVRVTAGATVSCGLPVIRPPPGGAASWAIVRASNAFGVAPSEVTAAAASSSGARRRVTSTRRPSASTRQARCRVFRCSSGWCARA